MVIAMKKLIIALVIFPVIGIILNVTDQIINHDSVVVLFKYFTILSNLFVGIYFSLLLSGKFEKSIFFNKLFASVLISITITFIVFAGYLEWTYESEGLNKIASLINHYITPILTITYFFLNKKMYQYNMKDMIVWMIFPVSYLMFLLIHGVVTRDFIYPFFQVDEVGLFALIITIVLLVGFFILMSFLVVKILSKNKSV